MFDKIAGYFSGKLGRLEESRLLDEISRDEALKKEFITIQNLNALSQLSALPDDNAIGAAGFERFLRRVRSDQRRRVIRQTIKYAALAIILVSSTFFATKLIYDNRAYDKELNTLFVPEGQRARISLADGSAVWLNSGSTLKYPGRFTGRIRHVEISGEGYFEISENKRKPFVVSSQNVEIRVLGTEFNLCSYPGADYIKADLIEGALKIYLKDHEDQGIVLRPNQQVTIKGNELHLSETVGFDYYLWKDGIYSFEDERLGDILMRLQLYYDTEIIVEDPDILEVRYTGKFRQRDGLDEILKIIQKIHHFKIEKKTEERLIRVTK